MMAQSKERRKQWQKENKEKVLGWISAWKKKNPEAVKESNAKYYQKRKEYESQSI